MTRLKGLYERLEQAHQDCARASRWGETRRFSGKMAGNRLARIDRLQRMIDKEYSKTGTQ
ncbi:hypothetical protein LCGC14_1050010 [marine sediment metagenome]|uniref:Uncharacterized protein n=1 Tax=marine sediment metagenome TaxID=412755 RepID=A0A0F9MP52_9ZZZZ